MMKRLHDHIFTVVGRYKGKIKGWDVVNEVVDDTNNQATHRCQRPTQLQLGTRHAEIELVSMVWPRHYIRMAFKWAHEADPAAELYYNDYNLDLESKVNNKRYTALGLVKYLQSKGAPIHWGRPAMPL